jgi:hypothetical protein
MMANAMKVRAMTIFATQRPRPCVWQLSGLALGVALGWIVPSACWAQMSNGIPQSVLPGGGMPGGGVGSPMHGKAAEKPVLAEPDSVPGAKARAPAAPATHIAGDMQPNDALFDAINRGDIAAARDALNRGAELTAVNILGMTPMELSVDLGRNDISFLLLSMRGDDSGRGARAVGRGVASGGPAPTGGGRAKVATGATAGGRTKSTEMPVAARPIARPKLFANDGGTPLPSAGFLGFEPRSASN